MKHIIAALALSLSLATCAMSGPVPAPPATAVASDADITAITTLLEQQDEAWNRGDIDAFMNGYWRSPELRFASGGNVTRGWEETNARYRRVYATPDLMGRLVTSGYEIVILSPDAAIVHGAWLLERANDRPSGLYTLVLRKTDGEWLIVSDTTTSSG